MKPWLKHYDKGVPADVQFPEVPLWKLLADSAQKYPDNVALEFMGKVIGYRQLWESALKFAGALRAQGVQPGDRVAIMLPNCPQFVIAFYGTLAAGGICVNVNPLYTPRELRHQLSDAGAETLIILDLLWPRYAEIEEEVPVKRVFTTGIQDYLPFPKPPLPPQSPAGKTLGKPSPGSKVLGLQQSPAQRSPGCRALPCQARRGSPAAVHRGNYRSFQGSHAHPPQPGGQHLPKPGLGWRRGKGVKE